MYSPEAISRDISSNLMYSSGNTSITNGLKNGFLEEDFFKSKEMLGSSSDLFQTHIQQQNSGLTRYRSAPSSYFASYLDGSKNNNTANNSDSSESDSLFSALMNCNEPSNEIPHHPNQRDQYHHHQQQQHLPQHQQQLKPEVNEAESNPSRFQRNGNEFSSVNSAMVSVGYQAAVSAGGGTVVGSYPVQIGVENQGRTRRPNNSSSSNLIRQSSSPAGFFSGYDVMREVANFRNGNGTSAETSSSTSGLNPHMNFTSGPSSSSRYMPSIAENGNETIGAGSPDQGFVSGYQNESWSDSSFNTLKRNRDGDLKMFSGFSGVENQDLEPRNHTRGLVHHLSLPATTTVEAASSMDGYLQFRQDSVLCKLRAKRGCATHPRSIAERMRRTRISDRMKKLQELFPNLDKQTNTADMLDLAVEYIKDLQNQVQTLTETRAKCTCSGKQAQCSSSHDA